MKDNGIKPPNVKDLLNMLDHRGPDGEGDFQSLDIILAHKRLAIIDLSTGGIQPMTMYNEDYPSSSFRDEQFTIVFNGEIYNYIELKEELKEIGIKFRTETDTEVLLKLFTIYNNDMYEYLNGQFVFCIWDNKKRILTVARDRFGIKPLYYTETKDYIAFSSEMKPLLALKEEIKLNPIMIYDYLVYNNTDHSNQTFFEDIHRFPASHYATVTKERLEIIKYWDLLEEVEKLRKNKQFKKKTLEEHISSVKSLFFNSVKLRLRADVIVGSCLSGGIDSSSVVCSALQYLSKNEKPNFELFSLVYGNWFERDERKYIDIVAESTGLKQNLTTANMKDVNSQFKDYMYYQEEPSTTYSAFGQYKVMELAAQRKTKVLLDGQGADELMVGYFPISGYVYWDLFKRLKWIRLVKELIKQRKNKMALKIFAIQFIPNFVSNKLWRRYRVATEYLTADFFQEYHGLTPSFDLLKGLKRKSLVKILIKDLENNFQSLLRLEDRNSMRFSIEARVPFLDHHFAIYVLALKSEYILRDGKSKWIFREAMENITPQEILERRDKIGFASPDFYWLRDKNNKLLQELNSYHPLLEEFVKIEKIDELLEKWKQDTTTDTELRNLFKIASLDLWLKLFISSN